MSEVPCVFATQRSGRENHPVDGRAADVEMNDIAVANAALPFGPWKRPANVPWPHVKRTWLAGVPAAAGTPMRGSEFTEALEGVSKPISRRALARRSWENRTLTRSG